MIELSLTEEALGYISHREEITVTKFVASSSFDLADIKSYANGDYRGDGKFLSFPAAYIQIAPKGRITHEGHEDRTNTETLVTVAGVLDASKASEKFEVNSIAIIAKRPVHGSYRHFVLAFGSLELNTYPLPVIAEDSMSFVIPFTFSYGDATEPPITAETSDITPWKDFLGHSLKQATDPMQTHGLWVDLEGMRFRVQGTSFPIPVDSGDDQARLDAIEEELEESALYSPSPAPQNSEFASVSIDGDYIEKSSVRVSSIASSASQSSLEEANQAIRAEINPMMPVSMYFSWSFDGGSGWTADGDIKYKDAVSDWDKRGMPLQPLSVTLIPYTRYNTKWYDYGLRYDIVYLNRYKNEPYLRIYANADTEMSGDIYYTLLIQFDPLYWQRTLPVAEYREITFEKAKWSGDWYYYYFYEEGVENWVYPLAYVDDPGNEDAIAYGIRTTGDGSALNRWDRPDSSSPYTWAVPFRKNSSPRVEGDITVRIRLLH